MLFLLLMLVDWMILQTWLLNILKNTESFTTNGKRKIQRKDEKMCDYKDYTYL